MANSLKSGFCRLTLVWFAGLVAAAVMLMVPATSWGQAANTGTVAGVITDSTNAIVPSATVTLRDTATGNTRSTTTNSEGRYIFANVPPSTYDITFSKAGFSQVKIAAQIVRVGLSLTENVTLQVGAATTTVEVQARGTDLQTMNSTVGNTISGTALSSLPSLGRDVSTFVTLQPGVSPDGSVAGTVVDQSSFQLDGGNNTNDMDGSMSVYTPSYSGDPTGGVANQGFGVAAGPTGVMPTPADSVQEFKVSTSNQTADFNSSSGAQVQVVTKRGTDQWHGTAYEYYFDNNWSANTWNNNAVGIKQPSYHYSRFGGAVGGPIIPKSFLGGKTYFFANYQGFRWPNSTTITKQTPTDSMRAGLLVFCGSTATTLADPSCSVFNLNPNPVTFNGITYPSSGLDPRGIGINPQITKLWAFMPEPNTSTVGDANNALLGNVAGFTGNMAIPQSDNFGVARIDHDFGSKWHFMGSYRYYKLVRASTSQVDIGGFFPGNKIGVPAAVSARPQEPWYYVAALTTDISPTTTNDFHWSFLRNWWAWTDNEDLPQFSGLGGALEPLGETSSPLAPYNLNTQSVRTRFWDGMDHMLRDDITTLHGNHLFQFGGTYEHNFNWHQRSDNGGGINYQPVYRMGGNGSNGAGIDMTGFVPAGVPAVTWGEDYAAMLGIVSISQTAYTRSGNNLALNPPNTHAFDQSTIPFYNVYFSDTWHMKPTFTLNYGLGWTLEMPPVERNGKQVLLVDASNQPIDTEAYLASRKRAALQGQVFNPQVGFALVGNTGAGGKYGYNPFYGSFSPRVSAAWNPRFDSEGFMGKIFGQDSTVIRGGYGRIYGRLNGVDLVLVPLLGTGLIQAVQCIDPLMDATTCAGSNGANPNTAFRIGTDGLVAPLPAASPTLPQPDFPGINDIAAGAGEALDPKFRPNVVDSFDLTVQRQLSSKVTLELGYIGRKITHEYQPININSVPYMMTLGGQTFANAYAAIEKASAFGQTDSVTGNLIFPNGAPAPQPFFETALAGTGYCTGFTSCTAAVIANEGTGSGNNLSTQSVWNIWSDMDGGGVNPGFNFPRSMMNTPLPGPNGASGQLTSGVGMNVSNGYGNYNAGFVTVKMADWKGLTAGSNFTWSKALGTGAEVQATSEYTPDDPFNLAVMYGLQPFDRKIVFNQYIVYQPPFYKGQQGFMGRVLGGWTIAPLFAAGSGLPIQVSTLNGDSQAFGEGDSNNFFSNENALLTGPNNFGSSAHFGVKGSGGVGVTGHGINMFANPAAVFAEFRQPILGLDGNAGGFGVLRGLPYWNLDLSVKKNVAITERFSAEFDVVFVNVLNHDQYTDPQGSRLDTSNPRSFGTITGEGTPRNMEFGLRLNF